MQFIHVCLNVTDPDGIADWYCEELGFERSWEFTPEGGTARNVYVSDPEGIEIQLAEAGPDADLEAGTAWDHLAVVVEDVDAAFEAIDHHGVVEAPTDRPAAGSRVAFVKDPDGHVVELVQPLD